MVRASARKCNVARLKGKSPKLGGGTEKAFCFFFLKKEDRRGVLFWFFSEKNIWDVVCYFGATKSFK
jgi:hypothetical protein